jgi:dienelactone hydrolase
MNNYKYVFFFSMVMMCMPFDVAGMQTVVHKLKDIAGFLDRHSGATCAVALGLLVVSTYYEEADSEEEELFNPLSYITRFLPAKETRIEDLTYDLKKMSGKDLKLEKIDDNEVGSIDPIGWLLFFRRYGEVKIARILVTGYCCAA